MRKTRIVTGLLVIGMIAGMAGTALAAFENTEVTGALNELIERAKDGQEGYQLAADKVESPQLKLMLGGYAKQREQYAQDLQSHVAKLGTTPETNSSATGSVHRGWINIKSAVTQGDKAILSEVIRGEEAAVKSYDNALGKALPQDVRGLVEKQREDIRESLEKIRAKQATLTG